MVAVLHVQQSDVGQQLHRRHRVAGLLGRRAAQYLAQLVRGPGAHRRTVRALREVIDDPVDDPVAEPPHLLRGHAERVGRPVGGRRLGHGRAILSSQ